MFEGARGFRLGLREFGGFDRDGGKSAKKRLRRKELDQFLQSWMDVLLSNPALASRAAALE